MPTDTRRDRLFALRMQIHLAERDQAEARDQRRDDTQIAERIRELREKHRVESWRGAP